MYKKYYKYPDKKAYEYVVTKLEENGVTLDDIIKASMKRQEGYMPEYGEDEFKISLDKVLRKRNVLNDCMIGLHLDELATLGVLPEPLQDIMFNDAGVFEVDEVFGIDIARDYGSVGVTNFGYLDCAKTDLVKSLDEESDKVLTFTDDLVSALIAATCACTMHRYYEEYVYTHEED